MVTVICSLTGKCLVLSFLMFLITHGSAECPSGKFGAFCEHNCHCERQQCDRRGRCISGARCQDGYSGLSCQTVLLPECEPEWFGFNCQHQCLCTDYKCDRSGQCISGSKCKIGYFGPACQYGDIIQLSPFVPNVPAWLRDGNDSTCNSNPAFKKLSINFDRGLPFYWFRLSVNNSGVLHSFNIQLNGNDRCHNLRNATVNDKIVDIFCDMSVAVKRLTLTGAGVSYLCSVYISLGRNVVLREAVSQSSFHLHGDLKTIFGTKDAGGRLKANADKISCPVTQEGAPISFWKHGFTTPQSVSAFFLNRRNASSEITIRTFNSRGQLVNTFESRNPQQQIYMIKPQPIALVSVTARSNESLSLCEIFMFGESLCPEGMFGLNCYSFCSCTDSRKICFTSTGACAAPCPAGFYGFNCSIPCPDSCEAGFCTPRYGRCIKNLLKLSSILQHDADQECPKGFFGKLCRTPCPAQCDGKCSPVTGECQMCDPGFYGLNCTSRCSTRCFNRNCHAEDGRCNECSSRTYGTFCQFECGSHCYLMECNSTTGKCFNCAPGYKGESCNLVPWNVTLFIVLLFLIPSVIACFFCCEVLSDEEPEDIERISTSTQMSILYSSAI